MDLSAQEVNLSVPELNRRYHRRRAARNRTAVMDLYLVGAIVMLVTWAVITFTTSAPGIVHLLLTGGVFLLIWRIVVRGTSSGTGTKS